MAHKHYNSRREFFEDRLREMKLEISNTSKDEILNIDKSAYLDYLVDKYSLEPLVIHRDKEEIAEPIAIRQEFENHNPLYGRYGYKRTFEGYKIQVSYPFDGDSILFFVQPNSWTVGGASATLKVEEYTKRLILEFDCWDMDADKFNRDKVSAFNNQVNHYLSINPEIEDFNSRLRSQAEIAFEKLKNTYLSENTFFKAINVKPSSSTSPKRIVPTVEKRKVPKPQIKERAFEVYPSMADEMYQDILKTMYQCGQSMERKPSLYIGKDEEALRDVFVCQLETRYDSVTATGETFNLGGKTDICLKHAETGTNLFIAECKFWHGTKAFHDAINQLFDRYLTVRDTKVALVFFVAGNDFTGTLETIKTEAQKHKYFLHSGNVHAQSSFSYIYNFPSDENKTVKLEIMAFHFPKATIIK